jgi:two-component system, NtrC family, sensor kinase
MADSARSGAIAGHPLDQAVLFQAVVDSLPVSLHVIDRTFRVVVWNHGRECGALGMPRGEALSRNLFDITGEDRDLRDEYETIFRTGRGTVCEVQASHGSPPKTFRVAKVPMRLGSGDGVSHVITFAQDVTEQRALERSMLQTEKMAAVGRVGAGIAHEINNPLATIAGCAESMASRLSKELTQAERSELYEDATLIEQEAYRCKGILQSLLDVTRSTPDGTHLCDLEQLAGRVAKLLRHNPRLRGIRVAVLGAGSPVLVEGAEEQLTQVMMALLLNAADAVGEEGNVIVRISSTSDEEACFSVEDDGPGIAPELHDKVFEPFFTTKPPGQGTGLGLSVAYGLIQAHRGRLSMSSHPGVGTRFDVFLPAAGRFEGEETP